MVTMAFDETQDEFRQLVRKFFQDKSAEAEVRRLAETDQGYDPVVWRQMAQELGLQGIAVPEEYGGQGFSPVEVMIVMEEAGRVLLCAPYLSTAVLAVNTLMCADDSEARKRYLPGIVAGETIATLAFLEESGSWGEDGIGLTAVQTDGEYRLTGRKKYVLDGHIADLVLVPARTASGVSLFAVAGDAPGLSAQQLSTMDQTRKQAHLDFSDTPATLIGSEGQAWPGLARALDLAAVALAAEQVGAAQAALDMSVEYAKVRYQFGRPIGSFQAIKHQCADLLVDVEAARSAAYYAAFAAAEDSDELPLVASLAKAVCSDALMRVSAANIQIHGGIGFTWEHPAHLYLKRAKTDQLYLGDPEYHRELVADRLGI